MTTQYLATPPPGTHWRLNLKSETVGFSPGHFACMELVEIDTGNIFDRLYVSHHRTRWGMWLASWFIVRAAQRQKRDRNRLAQLATQPDRQWEITDS